MAQISNMESYFFETYNVVRTNIGLRFTNPNGGSSPCIVQHLRFMDAPFKVMVYTEGNITVALDSYMIDRSNRYRKLMLNKFMEETGKLHLSTFTSNSTDIKSISVERLIADNADERIFSKYYFNITLTLNSDIQHLIKFNEIDRAEFEAKTLVNAVFYPLQFSYPVLSVPGESPQYIKPSKEQTILDATNTALAKYGAVQGWSNTKNPIPYPKLIVRFNTQDEFNKEEPQNGIAKIFESKKSLAVKINIHGKIILRYSKGISTALCDGDKFEWNSNVDYRITHLNLPKRLNYTDFDKARLLKDNELLRDIECVIDMLRAKTVFIKTS